MTPLEKAISAAGESLYGYADPNDTPNNWARSEAAARAALMAIRDGVTNETLEHLAGHSFSQEGEGEDWCHAWFAAIDHILQSNTEEGK